MNTRIHINGLISECKLLNRHFSISEPILVSKIHLIIDDLTRLNNCADDKLVENILRDSYAAILKCELYLIETYSLSVEQSECWLLELNNNRSIYQNVIELGVDKDAAIKVFLDKLNYICEELKKNGDSFKLLPIEVKLEIFKNSDNKILRQLAATNKSNRADVLQYATNQLYYAVGDPVCIYSTMNLVVNQVFYGSNGEIPNFRSPMLRPRTSFSADEIIRSLSCQYNIRLFPEFKNAYKCSLAESQKYEDTVLDVYHMYAIAPIFVVSIQNNLLIQPNTIQFNFDSRCQSPLKCIYTPVNNCKKIYFANMYTENRLHFFPLSKGLGKNDVFPNEFSEIWNNVFKNGIVDMEKLVKQAVLDLFSSYSKPVYSGKSRAHHAEANAVVQFIQDSNPSPSRHDLWVFLRGKREVAKDKQEISQQGHYFLMLDFAIGKISDLHEASLLPEIDSYFKRKMEF